VTAWEPAAGWSRQNLARDHGRVPERRFSERFPHLNVRTYAERPDIMAMLHGADLVIVHEWTECDLVAAIGAARKRGARFVLLFHDTHHRALSDPAWLRKLDLSNYDGVLAFGRSLAAVYERMGWGRHAFVLHEAADTRVFQPQPETEPRSGAVWVGNWGDGERSSEIARFLLEPARRARVSLDVYGVRYPASGLKALEDSGARYHGWIANSEVPGVFARHLMTVHVPRRSYADLLPGIPTIRVFEALACGIPLLSAPWPDCENLFRPGQDYIVARDGRAMCAAMRDLACDPALRMALVRSGLERIRARHTCGHRADELISIVGELQPGLRGAA